MNMELDARTVTSADHLMIDPETNFCVGDIRTSEQANEARGRLLIDCARIEAQLDAAHEYFMEHGHHRDISWMRRAKIALSFKKAALQRIQEVGGAIRRREKEQHNSRFEALLIQALKQHVGSDAFQDIVMDVRRQQEAISGHIAGG